MTKPYGPDVANVMARLIMKGGDPELAMELAEVAMVEGMRMSTVDIIKYLQGYKERQRRRKR